MNKRIGIDVITSEHARLAAAMKGDALVRLRIETEARQELLRLDLIGVQLRGRGGCPNRSIRLIGYVEFVGMIGDETGRDFAGPEIRMIQCSPQEWRVGSNRPDFH